MSFNSGTNSMVERNFAVRYHSSEFFRMFNVYRVRTYKGVSPSFLLLNIYAYKVGSEK